MKNTILIIILVALSGSAGWIVCDLSQPKYSKDVIQMANEMIGRYPDWENNIISPEQFEKLQDDVAYMREASIEEPEDFIFGVAYGNYKSMQYSSELGSDEANKKSAYAIKQFLKMYPDKNWGIHQKMADEIENWVTQNPDKFK